jgi:hypothetical protein
MNTKTSVILALVICLLFLTPALSVGKENDDYFWNFYTSVSPMEPRNGFEKFDDCFNSYASNFELNVPNAEDRYTQDYMELLNDKITSACN